MYNNWIVLLPPIVVLLLAFTTHRVIFSLLCGIITAALILNNFSISQTIQTTVSKIWENSELGAFLSWEAFKNNWGLFIFLFLIILGVIVVLITHSGGAYAYADYIKKKLKNKKATETSSLILSLFFFIDDHLSTLTVGSVMHPLCDKFKIARAKLAFLVDSMAAPICVIAPISSWAAYIIMQLKKTGVNKVPQYGTYILADPFFTFLETIPFVFYSLIMIASTWLIVRGSISIGLMKKHEAVAEKTGNLFAGKNPTKRKIRNPAETHEKNASMYDFLLPIIVLIVSVIVSLLYLGNFYLFGGTNNLIETFQATQTAPALFIGGTISLIFSLILFFIRKKLTFPDLPSIFKEGYDLTISTIVVLILAWTLSDLLKNDLKTGQYLASLLLGHLSIKLLPFMFFVATAATSFAMGSAWGSMAVMIPIAIPLLISFMQLTIPVVPQSLPILFPVLGAILSGGVSGNHTSPISDTTIMSATSSGSYHIDHVKTQYTYAIPVLCCTGISFLVSGFMISYNIYFNIFASLGTGILCNFGYLILRNNLKK